MKCPRCGHENEKRYSIPRKDGNKDYVYNCENCDWYYSELVDAQGHVIEEEGEHGGSRETDS